MSGAEIKNENEEVEIAVADDSTIDDDQFDPDLYTIWNFAIKEDMPEMIDYFLKKSDQTWRVKLYSHDSQVFMKAFKKVVEEDSVRDFLAHLDRFLILCTKGHNKIGSWVVKYNSKAILRVMIKLFCRTPIDKRLSSSDAFFRDSKVQQISNIQPTTVYYQRHIDGWNPSHIDGWNPSTMSKKQFYMRAASSTQDD